MIDDVQKNLRLALNEILKFSAKTYSDVYIVSVLYVLALSFHINFIYATSSAEPHNYNNIKYTNQDMRPSDKYLDNVQL
jgi:hypothetical protein